jgi:hypothetical protein
MTYYFIAEDSTMNSFSRDFLREIEMLEQVRSEILVPTLPLARFWTSMCHQGRRLIS